MRLYFYCSSCQEENSFKTKANNRFELQKERGNFIHEHCQKCGTIVKRRINRVHAKPNKLILILGIVFGIVFTAFLLLYVPLIILVIVNSVLFTIPFVIWRDQEKKASAFNKIMVDDEQ